MSDLPTARAQAARECAHRAMRDFIGWKELTDEEWEARVTKDAVRYAAPGGPLATLCAAYEDELARVTQERDAAQASVNALLLIVGQARAYFEAYEKKREHGQAALLRRDEAWIERNEDLDDDVRQCLAGIRVAVRNERELLDAAARCEGVLAEWEKTRAAFALAWRSEPVPALTTLRTHCEASGARVVIVDTADADARVSLKDRYGEALCPVLWSRVLQNRSDGVWVIGTLLRVQTGPSGGRYYAATFGEIESTMPRLDRARALPLPLPRGWCAGLSPGTPEASGSDPALADATWAAMRAACPERVYPEPSE